MILANKQSIQQDLIAPFFQQWEILSKDIHVAHEKRNGEATTLMAQGIALFEQLILTVSCTEASEIDSTKQYEAFPINGMERLLFIKARPGQYACYRQLDELFKECKKRLARLRIK